MAPGFAVDLLERMSAPSAARGAAQRALIDPLTERERTVLRYLAGTLTNAEIADELYVSVSTVKTHQRRSTQARRCRGGAMPSAALDSSTFSRPEQVVQTRNHLRGMTLERALR